MVSDDNKNIKNVSFFSRLFDVIDIPLFLYLGWSLVSVLIQKQDFYLDYYIYFAILGLVLAIFFPGFAGFRAAKDKIARIKPWIAGFFLSLVVSIFSLSLGVVSMIYFSDSLSENLISSNVDYGVSNDYSEESVDFETVEIETAQNENIQVQDSYNLNQEDSSNSLILWTLILGAVGVVFTSLFGALFGLIGGAIGKD